MSGAIVFDLDGTLIDSAPDIHRAALAVLAAEGLPPVVPAQSRSFIGNGAGVFVDRLATAAGVGNDAPRQARMLRHFLELYETAVHETALYPGVEAALEQLRRDGWRIGLCTNKPAGPARAVLRHFGLLEVFGTLIGGDSLPVRKPDPAPLRAVLDGLGGGPAVYVGDSEVDAETASRAELPFALFTEGYRKAPVEALVHGARFSDFAELPALAAGLLRPAR